MKRTHRLTTAFVRNAPPGRHPDGHGLYLEVSGAGASYVYRYRRGPGRGESWMGLGSRALITLAEARAAALKCRGLLHQGIDPLERRRAERTAAKVAAATAVTFDQAAEQCIAAQRAGWRNDKSREQWQASLRDYVSPVLGTLPVSAIDTALVMKVLEPIWTSKPETARRIRGRIERILDWAKAREYRTGENPARWRGHLQNLLADHAGVRRIQHHAALLYAEVPAFVAELRQQHELPARALELLIRCSVRTNELLGARWAEIDFNAGIWEIPPERTKRHKLHRVPLSPRAIEILEDLHSDDTVPEEFIFSAHRRRGGMSPKVMLGLLRRMGREVTVHGFRAVFRTWAAERTNFQHDVIEAALAHATGSAVVDAYQRGDLLEKRRRLMLAWDKYIDTPPAAAGTVVELRHGS
jgi:integrase